MRTRAPHRPPVARRPAPARDGCDDSAQRRAARPRGPWWWRPRIRSALALGALRLTAVLARVAAHREPEARGSQEVGQARVFWPLSGSRWLAGSLAGVGTT